MFDKILCLHEPWRSLTLDEFNREFQDVKGYIKDLLHRHDGEVVETQGEWELVRGEERPTTSDNDHAWHKQFATIDRDRQILASQKSITKKNALG